MGADALFYAESTPYDLNLAGCHDAEEIRNRSGP